MGFPWRRSGSCGRGTPGFLPDFSGTRGSGSGGTRSPRQRAPLFLSFSTLLDWGGTSHPVWFKHDPRVANCKAQGGLYDRALMEGVVQMAGEVGAKAAEMSPEEAEAFLAKTAAEVQSDDPPRENQRINISMDSAHASGPGSESGRDLNPTSPPARSPQATITVVTHRRWSG